MSKRLPALFIGHGSPTNALDDNEATRFWQQLPERVGPVRAILCISAHWHVGQTAVTAMPTPKTIHDFGRGLPAALFDIEYPAPGSPELANEVIELLAPEKVIADQQWGLDHGTWSVLCRAWPGADVPVVQLSMNAQQANRWHYDLARKLKPLREDGVLILGSGNLVHNLGQLEWADNAAPHPWATRANEQLKQCIEAHEIERLANYSTQITDSELAIPDLDHFLPLFYVLGVRDATDQIEFASDFIAFKSISMTSFMLT